MLLYRVGSKAPISRLALPPALAESCVTALGISRNGQRVAAVSTIPTHALAVWDVATGDLLPGVAGAALPPGVLYTEASFCPVRDSRALVTGGGGHHAVPPLLARCRPTPTASSSRLLLTASSSCPSTHRLTAYTT